MKVDAPATLVVAGVLFLFFGIVGFIYFPKLEPKGLPKWPRWGLTVLGAILLVTGLLTSNPGFLSGREPPAVGNPSAQPSRAGPVSSPTARTNPTPTTLGPAVPLPKGSAAPSDLRAVFPQAGAGKVHTFKAGLSYAFVPDAECHESSHTVGLRLDYKPDGTNTPGWYVEWLPPGTFDVSSFSAVTFSVKGNQGGESFQVAMDSPGSDRARVNLADDEFTIGWKQVSVPLGKFQARGFDLRAIQRLNIVFNKDQGPGVICIDEIRFQ